VDEILASIPQRPPFLFVDKIVERDENLINTELTLSGEEDFFKGHFPGNPIMPGVLLQEALFQTGALLMSKRSDGSGLGVVTKVSNARFKSFVKPGDTLSMKVELLDQVGHAFYMKGQSRVNGKLVVSLEFSCALVEQ